jgi:hypothetical protein
MTMIWKLLIAASLLVACQGKPELPRAAKRMAVGRANPLVIIGNGAAISRIPGLGSGASR